MEVWIRQSMAFHPHVDGPMPFPVPGWILKTYSWKKDGGRPARGVGWGTAEVTSGHFLLGDPESLTRQIVDQQKATNAGVLVIRPEMGNMSLQEAGDGMELFSREVLPVLRDL